MKVGIILTPDNRSKSYIQKIINNKIIIDEIIFLNDNRNSFEYADEIIAKSLHSGFNISESVQDTLNKNSFSYKEFNFVDINNKELINFLSKSKTEIFIFTGGGILRDKVLSCGPKFVHLHPGIIPNYRGSTCFYYSIINDDSSGVTAYFMDKNIDSGNIIYQRTFEKPNHKFIDEVFDPFIRSETLVFVLKNNLIEKTKIKKPSTGEMYYVIHPVLKHISILSCLK